MTAPRRRVSTLLAMIETMTVGVLVPGLVPVVPVPVGPVPVVPYQAGWWCFVICYLYADFEICCLHAYKRHGFMLSVMLSGSFMHLCHQMNG